MEANIARKHNRERAQAIRLLLNAAAYLRDRNFPVNFDVIRAIRILLECAVKALASPIYMAYGLRIDRNDGGRLELVDESHYYTKADGGLIRLS